MKHYVYIKSVLHCVNERYMTLLPICVMSSLNWSKKLSPSGVVPNFLIALLNLSALS